MPHESAKPISLDGVIEALGLRPEQVQCFDPAYPQFDAQRPLLVLAGQREAALPYLERRYEPHEAARVLSDGRVEERALADLDAGRAGDLAWLLPAVPPERDRGSIAGLRGVMERLFGPDGCPWDREQTPETLRPFFLEECYELVDAIDRGDPAAVREELGDVMAHLFMQTAIAQLEDSFTADEVADHARSKMVRRHPHVFGEEESGTAQELLGRWEEIKAAERAERGESARVPGVLDSVPRAAPSLIRAQSMIGKALREAVGADADEPRETVRAALERLPERPAAEEIGALLWAVVHLARASGIDAEESLRLTADGFAARFAALEQEARAAGAEVAGLDAERRAATWPGGE